MFSSKLPMHPSQSAAPFTQVWLMAGWRVQQDGKACDIPSGQPRSLRTYLLLQPGHSAPRSTLVEELWPGAAPFCMTWPA